MQVLSIGYIPQVEVTKSKNTCICNFENFSNSLPLEVYHFTRKNAKWFYFLDYFSIVFVTNYDKVSHLNQHKFVI